MAIIKAVSSRSSIGRAINYVTKDEKTEEKLISGQDCNPSTAIEEMNATKAMWDKTEGREYYHFVQSFSPEEQITHAEAHEIASKLAEERFKGHEVVIATHLDKSHIHTHFIVNSVNHENGKKLHWKKQELQRMKDMSDTLCKAHGKSICERTNEIGTYSNNKYKALERGMQGGYMSYVLDCYNTASLVKDQAINKGDFIDKMKAHGYETTWDDQRKYITFEDKAGHKIRNSNLEKTFKEPFGKEDLERGFESNHETTRTVEQAREQIRTIRDESFDSGTTTNNFGTEGGIGQIIIDAVKSTIREAEFAIRADERDNANRNTQEQSHKSKRNGTSKSEPSEGHKRSPDFER